jgi:hypothetical protein
MRCLLASVTAVIMISSPANALRGVDRETKCERIQEIEAGLGSTLVRSSTWKSTTTRVLAFEGRSNGRDASILYVCDSGKAEYQSIGIRMESEHDGGVVFADWHGELSARMGPPVEDLDELEVRELEEATDLQAVRRVASWWDGEHMVSVTLLRLDGNWNVLLSGP